MRLKSQDDHAILIVAGGPHGDEAGILASCRLPFSSRAPAERRKEDNSEGEDPTSCSSRSSATPPGEEPEGDSRIEAIAGAARRLDELRRNWLNPEGVLEAELKKRTLTNLYNARPTWLENAHERLDEAVFAAYGWPPELSDEEILQNLLALNLKRSKPR